MSDTSQIGVRTPVKLRRAAEMIAEERGLTLSELTREALREKVAEELGFQPEVRRERDRSPVPA